MATKPRLTLFLNPCSQDCANVHWCKFFSLGGDTGSIMYCVWNNV